MKFGEISKKLTFLLMVGLALFCIVLGIFFVPDGPVKANPASSTLQSTSPFYTGRDEWLTLPSTFAGKVVHYSLTEAIYVKQDSGPDKNIKLFGDVWEQIDASGELQKYHVVYTNMANNTFYQEIYEDSSSHLVVFNKKDAPHSPVNASVPSCSLQMPARSQSMRNADLIPFANTLEMQKEGFSVNLQTSSVSQAVPNMIPKKDSTYTSSAPVVQYPNATTIHVWTLTQMPGTGGKRLHHVELDSNNRVVFEQATLTDALGNVLSSTTFAFGPAILYNPQDVASGALSNAQQILEGGCS